jgi:D-lactate dehydrogenase (cytochrome)
VPPDAVVWAENADEISALLQAAAPYGVPVIAYGAGSSLEGHLLAVRGGISLNLTRMDAILRIDAEDLTVTVQPGVTRLRLNQELRHAGLGHQRRTLRHDARKRAGAEGSSGRRPAHPHRQPDAQIGGRLRPDPPVRRQRRHFPDLGAAVDTTIAIIQAGVPIARCELLDQRAIRAVNAHDHLGPRDITPTCRPCRPGPAVAPSPPMPACRSRG